jgi:hypothetical protein
MGIRALRNTHRKCRFRDFCEIAKPSYFGALKTRYPSKKNFVTFSPSRDLLLHARFMPAGASGVMPASCPLYTSFILTWGVQPTITDL